MDELVARVLPYRETFLLVMCRLIAMFMVAPVLGHRALPVVQRVGVALMLSMLVASALGPTKTPGGIPLGAFAGEIFVGLVIGFVASLVLAAVASAGELLGFQMGLGVAAVFDPSFGGQTTAVTRFYDVVALLLLVTTNTHHLIIRATTASFRPIHPGSVAFHAGVGAAVATLGGKLLRSGLELAAPLAGILFLVNVAMALLARVAPQMNVFTIGLPITIAVGIFGLVDTLPHVAGVLSRLIAELAADLDAALGA